MGFPTLVRCHLYIESGPRTPCRCPQGSLVTAGYRPRHSDRCPRLTPDYRPATSCWHTVRHRNWNHQHSSHVLFADGCIVSFYSCNEDARVFHHVVERLVNCYIQETCRILRWSGWQRLTLDSSSNIGWDQWASCQIRKIVGAHAPGMPGTFSPSPQVSDPDMHHGTCRDACRDG